MQFSKLQNCRVHIEWAYCQWALPHKLQVELSVKCQKKKGQRLARANVESTSLSSGFSDLISAPSLVPGVSDLVSEISLSLSLCIALSQMILLIIFVFLMRWGSGLDLQGKRDLRLV